jgi:hypothetical protein
MADVGARSKIYDSVVAAPATKAAAAATITGTVLYPFEPSGWGGASVVCHTDDDSKITDTLTVKMYVSFDEGTTWLHVANDATMANGSAGAVTTRTWLPLAPRVRVDLVFDGSAELAADHGVTVDVEFQESLPEAARTLFTNAVTMGDSEGTEVGFTKTGDTMLFNSPSKATVYVTGADASLIGDTITSIVLQSSLDTVNWWSQSTLGTIALANGTGPISLSEEETTSLSKYGRIIVTGDSAAGYYTGHGIQFHVLTQE